VPFSLHVYESQAEATVVFEELGVMVRSRISVIQDTAHGLTALAAEPEFLGRAVEVAIFVKSEMLLSVSVSPP
jgi:hypothetical protein